MASYKIVEKVMRCILGALPGTMYDTVPGTMTED